MFRSIILLAALNPYVGPSCGASPTAEAEHVCEASVDELTEEIEDTTNTAVDFDPPPEIWTQVDGNEPAPREPYVPNHVKIDWETP